MPNEPLATSIEAIKGWMLSHGAPLLVENLAPGATDEELLRAEERFGFALPSEVKALWGIHHGQRKGGNPFVDFRDLLGTERSLAERETVEGAVDFLRANSALVVASGSSEEELAPLRWVPIAGCDSDLLVVSGVSGRVFRCETNSPPLFLEAPSVVAWFTSYAARVVADDYTVEEGFGDYYLSLRDRARERRDAERADVQNAALAWRRDTSLLEQLRVGLSKHEGWRCREVFEDVVACSPELLPKAIDELFGATTEASLIASALQVVLRKVTLTKSQWAIVAAGGKVLGNEAIVAIALERRGGPAKPWWRVW